MRARRIVSSPAIPPGIRPFGPAIPPGIRPVSFRGVARQITGLGTVPLGGSDWRWIKLLRHSDLGNCFWGWLFTTGNNAAQMGLGNKEYQYRDGSSGKWLAGNTLPETPMCFQHPGPYQYYMVTASDGVAREQFAGWLWSTDYRASSWSHSIKRSAPWPWIWFVTRYSDQKAM